MLILSILLSLLTSPQSFRENVSIDFKFESMGLGKPTLAFYHYKVTLTNNTNKIAYVAIPSWFDSEIALTSNVWGAQYDSFGDIQGSTLFSTSGDGSFTVFTLSPKEKITIPDFTIETFDEGVQNRLSTGIKIIVCSDITVGEYSLPDFMNKNEVHSNNLEYQLKDAKVQAISIKTRK